MKLIPCQIQYTIITSAPGFFHGYPGAWYCVDKKPQKVVFEVLEPQLDFKIWDLDHNQDVSGKTIPVSANITYRVDTNLNQALQPLNRPDINPIRFIFYR